MAKNKQYDPEYKIQAVKLAKEIGASKAAKELGISSNTLYGWISVSKKGRLTLSNASQTPEDALNMAEELAVLRKQVKAQNKEIKYLKEMNDFLEEASAFFAASRLKSAKTKE